MMRLRSPALLALVAGVVIVAVVAVVTSIFEQPAILTTAVVRTGSFAPETQRPFDAGTEPYHGLEITLPRFESYGGHDTGTGRLETAAFAAPDRVLVYASGYPSHAGNALYLELVSSGERVAYAGNDPGETWHELSFAIPSAWRGRPIRLVAVDGATTFEGWLGVSLPFAHPAFLPTAHAWRSTAVVGIACLIDFAVLFLPGLAFAVFAARAGWFPFAAVPTLTLVASSLTGLLTFFVFFLDQRLGTDLDYVVTLFSAYVLSRPESRRMLTLPRVWAPMVLTLGLALISLGILLFGSPAGTDPTWVGLTRFFALRPPDSVIPSLLADRIYTHAGLHDSLFGYLGSDRPPLQSGLILLARPFMPLLDPQADAYIVGIIAQCTWVIGAMFLLWSMNVTWKRTVIVVGLVALLGFTLFNDVYAWPKMLAAALGLSAYGLIFKLPQRYGATIAFALSGAAAASLSLLAHGSTAFAIGAFLLIALWQRPRYAMRTVASGAALALCLYAPWMAYQHFFDPPGDRLIKMHLAGVIDVDPRSAVQAITDAYRSHGIGEIAGYKWLNVETILGIAPLVDSARTGEASDPRTLWRLREREQLVPALGFLNLGWIALALPFLIGRLRAFRNPIAAELLLVAALSSLVVCALLFFPSVAVTTHISYVSVLCAGLAAALAVATFGTRATLAVAALEVVDLAMTWLYGTPPGASARWVSADESSLALALAGVALLVWAVRSVPDAASADAESGDRGAGRAHGLASDAEPPKTVLEA
jgi:hypothetical protein